MSRVLPVLFNTDMVRAILDGRKTVTRRLIKHDVDAILNSPYHKEHHEVEDKQIISKLCMPPYQPGDILYIRETWCRNPNYKEYYYKTRPSGIPPYGLKWKPSIHMPKEAARIWLKVKDVRVERLQDIPHDGALKEGIHFCECPDGFTWKPETDMHNCYITPMGAMQALWNSTIKKSDIDRYGWDANLWVWVIEFERCEKPEDI